jgi:very-short-patch-repair endonuclease
VGAGIGVIHAAKERHSEDETPGRRIAQAPDGSPHLNQIRYDPERTKYLESKGCRVLRFWNHEVKENIDAVMPTTWAAINPQ